MKKCPYCAEKIQKKAVVCKHCHRELPKELNAYEKRQQQKEKEAKKEQAYLDGLSKKEKEAYLSEKKRKKQLKALWWVVGFSSPTLLLGAEKPFFAFLIVFVAIWLHPRKEQSFFENRFKDFRQYRLRIVFSVLALFVALLNIAALSGREAIESYPRPAIEILSGKEDQGDATDYTLRIKAENTTEILVGNKPMSKEAGSDNVFVLNLPLESPKNVFRLTAKNEHKEGSETLTLTRNKNEADLEKERQAEEQRLARQQGQINQEKEKLQLEIDSFNKPFDNSPYRSSVDSIQIEVVLFATWAKLIKEAKSHSDQGVVSLGKQLEGKVFQLQTREFPLMRKAYADLLAKKLWEQDIEVRVRGNANGTIEFVGGLFAANKNIKDAQSLISEILELLRFDRANYKWFEYDSDYSYYDIESKRDNELVEL